MLNVLNGSEPVDAAGGSTAGLSAVPTVQFGSSTGQGKAKGKGKGCSGGVFFADQPSSAWQLCDAGDDIL